MQKLQKMMIMAALFGITGMALADGPVMRALSMQAMALRIRCCCGLRT